MNKIKPVMFCQKSNYPKPNIKVLCKAEAISTMKYL